MNIRTHKRLEFYYTEDHKKRNARHEVEARIKRAKIQMDTAGWKISQELGWFNRPKTGPDSTGHILEKYIIDYMHD